MLAETTGRVNRITKVDTEILGQVISSGTDIIMNGLMISCPVSAAEHLRSASSRGADEKVRRDGLDGLTGEGLSNFQPEH
jgi:hypothetical protein